MDETVKLTNLLLRDLKEVGLPTDFKLELRGYSKNYNGTYDPNKKRIVLYAKEENGQFREYHLLFLTVLHETIHHYQHNYQEGFVRLKGVMHDPKFHELFNVAKEKAVSLKIIERKDCDEPI